MFSIQSTDVMSAPPDSCLRSNRSAASASLTLAQLGRMDAIAWRIQSGFCEPALCRLLPRLLPLLCSSLGRDIYLVDNDGEDASQAKISRLTPGAGTPGEPLVISRRGDHFDGANKEGVHVSPSGSDSVFHAMVAALGWQDFEQLARLRDTAGMASPRGGGSDVQQLCDWLSELVRMNVQAHEVLAPLLESVATVVLPSDTSMRPAGPAALQSLGQSEMPLDLSVGRKRSHESTAAFDDVDGSSMPINRYLAQAATATLMAAPSSMLTHFGGGVSQPRPGPKSKPLTPKQEEIRSEVKRMQGETRITHACRVKEKFPSISEYNLAAVSDVSIYRVRNYAKLRTLTPEQEAMRRAVPREPRQSDAAYARCVKQKMPNISEDNLAAVSGVYVGHLRRDPPLKPLTPEQAAVLSEVKPDKYETHIAHARRVKKAKPDISEDDLAAVSQVSVDRQRKDSMLKILTQKQKAIRREVPRWP